MASVRKKRSGFACVYYFTNDQGERKQRWEQFSTYAEAHKRRAEIEYKQSKGDFVAPTKQTIAAFMEDFVSLYGPKKWGTSVYAGNTSLIANYINPIIGDLCVQDINTRAVDVYIQKLQKTQPVETNGRKAKAEFLPPPTIEKIFKLLRCAFKQAVRWEIVSKNPFDNAVLPKVERVRREIWNADMIKTALDQCTDAKLYVAMNLSFACSMRVGEILGLTWDNTHISDTDIAADDAYVYIDKELARVSREAMEIVGNQGIIKVFPIVMSTCSTTRLVLKNPKTESSVRKVWLPKTVAYILREWKESQQKQMDFLGDEYVDYNLVVAQSNGRPCEIKLIENGFNRLKERAGLPNVVFHSLRHSSTTYKLKLNKGDIKATQGDTGHAESDMVTQVYAHILDEDRKVGAQKFEAAFYSNPDLREAKAPGEQPVTLNVELLIAQLRNSPELASALAGLIAKPVG
ncbi:MAG: site-specific integrase [Oscillospiraceae bacterium]